MKVSNETKVGILAAISITILVLGYNFMKGKKLWSESNTYYAQYDDVDGLFASNPVVVNGYNIGQVVSVNMDPKTLKLVVSVSIPKEIDVPKNSSLKIINSDMVGSKAIELVKGDDSTGMAVDGDTLVPEKDPPIVTAVTDVLTPIAKNLKKVLQGIDSAVSGVDLQATMQDLSDALSSFKKTAVTLNSVISGESDKLAGILENVEKITRDLKASTPKIDQVISDLDSTSSMIASVDFTGLTEGLSDAVNKMKATLDRIEGGQGSLGKLATEDELYNNLNEMIQSMDSLAKDIQRYPLRYTGIKKGTRLKEDERKNRNEGNVLPPR